MTLAADLRKYARIESSLSCSVATASDTFEAAVVNLSKSGAAILGPDSSARLGETVTVLLERREGLLALALPARVVRAELRGERTLYGVEFQPLPPDEQAQLGLLLQLVSAGPGQGLRQHPRLAARVEVSCRSEDIFRGMLGDLSKGGLSVNTPRPVAVGRPMVVSFGAPGLKGLVEVGGEVVSSQPSGRGYRIGVKFTPLTDDEQAQVARLLDVLLGIGLPEAQLVGDDD